MTFTARILAAATFFFAAQPGYAAEPSGFEGVWVGELRLVAPDATPMPLPKIPSPLQTLKLAIWIHDDQAQVFVADDSGWDEVKPQGFGYLTHRSNAIVAAIDSRVGSDGVGWVETWNFTLTRKDDAGLYDYWVRAVNNVSLPAESDPQARFFMSAFGEFKKSGPLVLDERSLVSGAPAVLTCLQTSIVCGN